VFNDAVLVAEVKLYVNIAMNGHEVMTLEKVNVAFLKELSRVSVQNYE
jgi:hypothetical protein